SAATGVRNSGQPGDAPDFGRQEGALSHFENSSRVGVECRFHGFPPSRRGGSMRGQKSILMTIFVSAVAMASTLPARAGTSYPNQEYHDRIVDAAALSSKLSAIRELKILIRQRHGTSDE